MAKKIKKYKVGTDSETYAISMVEMPAIEEDFVALSKDEEEKQQVFLEANEKHMVYGAVLVPDKDIYRNNGEQEFYISFTKDSIEKMSQDFMKEYRQHEVTVDHEDIANEVCVVESWLKADQFKDKSVALGLNDKLPVGTWFCGMKVNNIETWERIKAGELKGFSVESVISLEEFSKQNDNNMNIETNDMFWDKLKNILKEAFSKKAEADIESSEAYKITPESALKELDTILEKSGNGIPNKTYPLSAMTEPQVIELANNSGFTSVESYLDEVYAIKEELEEEKAAEAPETEVIEVKIDPPTEEEQAKILEEIKSGATEDVKPEEVKPQEDNKHLEELINSLKEEINALKEMNNGLNDKVKELSKEPSAKPVNTNAKTSAKDTYSAWREQMRSMIG
jgi:FtsZ-binding cell division protein ZapB